MNVAETIIVFVGIPLAFVVLLALLIFLPGRTRSRYKSGQPWEHAPVWYEPHPEHTPGAGHHSHHALDAGAKASAGPLGGARGTW